MRTYCKAHKCMTLESLALQAMPFIKIQDKIIAQAPLVLAPIMTNISRERPQDEVEILRS